MFNFALLPKSGVSFTLRFLAVFVLVWMVPVANTEASNNTVENPTCSWEDMPVDQLCFKSESPSPEICEPTPFHTPLPFLLDVPDYSPTPKQLVSLTPFHSKFPTDHLSGMGFVVLWTGLAVFVCPAPLTMVVILFFLVYPPVLRIQIKHAMTMYHGVICFTVDVPQHLAISATFAVRNLIGRVLSFLVARERHGHIQDQEHAPLREDQEHAPVRENQEHAPVREDQEHAPAREDHEHAPAREDEHAPARKRKRKLHTPVRKRKGHAPVRKRRRRARSINAACIQPSVGTQTFGAWLLFKPHDRSYSWPCCEGFIVQHGKPVTSTKSKGGPPVSYEHSISHDSGIACDDGKDMIPDEHQMSYAISMVALVEKSPHE